MMKVMDEQCAQGLRTAQEMVHLMANEPRMARPSRVAHRVACHACLRRNEACEYEQWWLVVVE